MSPRLQFERVTKKPMDTGAPLQAGPYFPGRDEPDDPSWLDGAGETLASVAGALVIIAAAAAVCGFTWSLASDMAHLLFAWVFDIPITTD